MVVFCEFYPSILCIQYKFRGKKITFGTYRERGHQYGMPNDVSLEPVALVAREVLIQSP